MKIRWNKDQTYRRIANNYFSSFFDLLIYFIRIARTKLFFTIELNRLVRELYSFYTHDSLVYSLNLYVRSIHVFRLSNMNVVESLSTISTCMCSGFVQVDVYFRMSHCWMSTIAPSYVIFAGYRSLFRNQISSNVGIYLFFRKFKTIKTVIRTVPRLKLQTIYRCK
jgi:hypothetical protein